MNLQKLYTVNGPIFINADDLKKPRQCIPIYTARGNKLSEVARTKAEKERAWFGVHTENLFASRELAEANKQRIYKEKGLLK